jgi:hypothetical protein
MNEVGKHEDGLDLSGSNVTGLPEEDQAPEHQEYLSLVGIAKRSFEQYFSQNVQKSWATAYKAFHNEHSDGSKYTDRKNYGQRSRLFRPKTRSAVRKDAAAVASSLFGTVDTLSCLPGNESDPRQVAAASLIQELVNYRTDRTSGRNAIPWFLTAMGARQDAEITGVCVSKQSWRLELREDGEEPHTEPNPLTGEHEQVYTAHPETGEPMPAMRPKMTPAIDRPDCTLYPPDRVMIDPAADWTNPAQSSAYLILMNPMRIDDIRKRQEDPKHPWLDVPPSAFTGTTESTQSQAISRARESGVDRLSRNQNPQEFEVIWVYEVFMRCHGEDVCFYSIEDRALLTEPRPVREIYPEQNGDRPVTYGYGAIESHRITPMSPVESWQSLQSETNDVVNLFIDTLKQNIAPITKVKRGKRVDLAALHRKGPNTNILLDNMDDVTFEAAPPIPATVMQGMQTLQLDMDDLAGQFNSGSVQDNRSLNETVGGLKLIAGAANAVQEFDIRVWIETWTEPTLAQIVRLEQYYESDATVLALCGDRAKLAIKHGINQIDDDLIESQVSIRVNAGLGAGDPAQKLKKFADAFTILGPILQTSKEFQTGQKRLNTEAICDEVFGAQGYRDGGARFIIEEKQPAQPPPPPPDMQAKIQELISKAAKNHASADRDRLEGIASFTKAAGDLASGAMGQVPPPGGIGGGAGMPGAPAPAGGQGPAPPPPNQAGSPPPPPTEVPDGMEQAFGMFVDLLKEHFQPKRELIHGPDGVVGARETVGGKETRRWNAKRHPATNELMGFEDAP